MIKQSLRSDDLKLMTHVVVGYPSLQETEDLILMMDKVGVDFIELQIPFSDPLADGPAIMQACERSLKNGTRVKDAFAVAKKLSKQIKTPLLFMAYFNTVYKYGIEKFCFDAKRAGVKGLIVPDFPLEEEQNEHFNRSAKENKLLNIKVLSPASTEERIIMNSKVATGFVYCTARQGITGTQKEFDKSVIKYLKTVRKYFNIPVALGFGISKKEHLDQIKGLADMAVVGSAILDIIRTCSDFGRENYTSSSQNLAFSALAENVNAPQNYLKEVEKFLLQLKK